MVISDQLLSMHWTQFGKDGGMSELVTGRVKLENTAKIVDHNNSSLAGAVFFAATHNKVETFLTSQIAFLLYVELSTKKIIPIK
jgi:hypothetical protein